jgi:hypothetical protein
MLSETENTIKVVLRTRPTQYFAAKNISLDSMENVTNTNIENNNKRSEV